MIRVLQDPPLDGPANMARDEVLLNRVGSSLSHNTLRFYQWNTPTISLGYFQPYQDFLSLPPPAGSLPVVRRLTGGGAILHDMELTYAMALPISHPHIAQRPNHFYKTWQAAIIESLKPLGVLARECDTTDDSGPSRGPFFCFSRRHKFDVILQNTKLAGSAQRRTRRAVLQHGSIILSNRFEQQNAAILSVSFNDAIHHLRASLPLVISRFMGERLEDGEWEKSELDASATLKTKYAGDQWTKRR